MSYRLSLIERKVYKAVSIGRDFVTLKALDPEAHEANLRLRDEVVLVPAADWRGVVDEAAQHEHEAYRLRAIMAEAVKQDPETCRKWISDALAAGGGQ